MNKKWNGKVWVSLKDTITSNSFATVLLSITNKNKSQLKNSFELMQKYEFREFARGYLLKQAIQYKRYQITKDGILLFGTVSFVSSNGDNNYAVRNSPIVVLCNEEFDVKNYWVYFNLNLEDNVIKPILSVSSFPVLSQSGGFILPIESKSVISGSKSTKLGIFQGQTSAIGRFKFTPNKHVFYLDSVFSWKPNLCELFINSENTQQVQSENTGFHQFVNLFGQNDSIYVSYNYVPVIQSINNLEYKYRTSIHSERPCFIDSPRKYILYRTYRPNLPNHIFPSSNFWVQNQGANSVFFIWNCNKSSIELLKLDRKFNVVGSKIIDVNVNFVPIYVDEGRIFFIDKVNNKVDSLEF